MLDFINQYLDEIRETISRMPAEKINKVLDIIFEAYKNDKCLFIFGNGGSAATASHVVCDVAKGTVTPGKRRFKAMCLSDNAPLITAWANDTDYRNTFGEQLKKFVQPGDVALGLSFSGMSPNVINAFKTANDMGATSVLFSGRSGGEARKVAHVHILVPSDHMQQIEDIHAMLCHILFVCLRERISTYEAGQAESSQGQD